jgi:cytochrome c-type biogenesis protein CcmH
MTRTWHLVAVVVALGVALAAAAPASACRPRTSVADVEDEVMCLVCGVPLSLATDSPQAQRERALIARRAAACWTKRRIKSELVADYGSAVLVAPPGDGFGVSAWLVPLGGLALLGTGLVAATGARRRRAELDSPRSAA